MIMELMQPAVSVRVAEGQAFQVLSLTGGGYRGLYTAKVLEGLEQKAGKPIGRCFDLVAGTSIGGILALAVAFEVPMQDVVKIFIERGKQIFPRTGYLSGLFSSKYSARPLIDAIESIFPLDARIADATHALVIPALNLTLGRQQIIKTRHDPAFHRDMLRSVKEVALATAAAPIYFPITEMDNQLYSDGGLFANAPDLVALHEANVFFNMPDAAVRMLSLGTLSSEYSIAHSSKRNLGLSYWLRIPSLPLVQTILSAQEQFALQIVAHRLADRHLRIDEKPPVDVRKAIGLDKVTEDARKTLLAYAAESVTRHAHSPRMSLFLSHEPQSWLGV